VKDWELHAPNHARARKQEPGSWPVHRVGGRGNAALLFQASADLRAPKAPRHNRKRVILPIVVGRRLELSLMMNASTRSCFVVVLTVPSTPHPILDAHLRSQNMVVFQDACESTNPQLSRNLVRRLLAVPCMPTPPLSTPPRPSEHHMRFALGWESSRSLSVRSSSRLRRWGNVTHSAGVTTSRLDHDPPASPRAELRICPRLIHPPC
jgi:hypothetical protein